MTNTNEVRNLLRAIVAILVIAGAIGAYAVLAPKYAAGQSKQDCLTRMAEGAPHPARCLKYLP